MKLRPEKYFIAVLCALLGLISCKSHAQKLTPLRLQLTGSRQGLQVDIFKRRGPPCEKSLLLKVARPVSWGRVRNEVPRMVKPARKPQLTVVATSV